VFKIHELLEATNGKLIKGRPPSSPSETNFVAGKLGGLIRGISLDSRTIMAGEAFIAIKGNNFDGHDFIDTAIKKGASCIIKERGKAKFGPRKAAIIEVRDTIKALGDIAKFHRKRFNVPVIAITGSTGKTTTKEMLSWILSSKFKVLKNEGTKNNNIGLPQTLLGLEKHHDIVIAELGTNHFGEIANLSEICQPNAGIITNIGPSHLEYFHDLNGVFREKYSLIRSLKGPSFAILNADDRFFKMRLLTKNHIPFMLGFSINNQSEFQASAIKNSSGKLEFCVNKKQKFILKTLGLHNIYNTLAAIACGRIFGMGYKDMAGRLGNFEFPEGRLKLIELKQKRFIDDTYNSNPASLKQALKVLEDFKTDGEKIFIMGDMLELGKFAESFHYRAGKVVAKSCDKFITVGKLSKLAQEAAKKSGFNAKNIFSCDTASEAREILFKDIVPDKNDIILVKGSRAMKMEEIFR